MGWRKLSPASSKKPRPFATWRALAVMLVRHGSWRMAVAVLIQLLGYLRVQELLGAVCGDLLAPTAQGHRSWALVLHPAEREVRSKTGETHESVTFSTELALPLVPVLKFLSCRPAGEKILDVPHPVLLSSFKRAAKEVGLLDMVPSEARRSGVIIELSQGLRSLPEAQKQGRWMTQKSRRRYEKGSEINKEWQRYSESQRGFFQACERELGRVLLENRLSPAL